MTKTLLTALLATPLLVANSHTFAGTATSTVTTIGQHTKTVVTPEQHYISPQQKRAAMRKLQKQFIQHVAYDGSCKIWGETKYRNVLGDRVVNLECVGHDEFDEQVAIAVRKANIKLPAFKTIVWTAGYEGAQQWGEKLGRKTTLFIGTERSYGNNSRYVCFTDEGEPLDGEDHLATKIPEPKKTPTADLIKMPGDTSKYATADSATQKRHKSDSLLVIPKTAKESAQIAREKVDAAIAHALAQASAKAQREEEQRMLAALEKEVEAEERAKEAAAKEAAASKAPPVKQSESPQAAESKPSEPYSPKVVPLVTTPKSLVVRDYNNVRVSEVSRFDSERFYKNGYVVQLGDYSNPESIDFKGLHDAMLRTAILGKSEKGSHYKLATYPSRTRSEAVDALALLADTEPALQNAKIVSVSDYFNTLAY